MGKEVIVTKEWLKEKVLENPSLYIGRALVALFNRQTSEERANNATKFLNGKGFSHNDGRIGALGAKYYLKHQTLLEWQLKPWLKLDKKGYPRIVRYTKQLNEAAIEKAKLKELSGLSTGASEALKIIHSGRHVH